MNGKSLYSDKELKDSLWAQPLAIEFYQSEFLGDKGDVISFTTAISFDVTIMILGFSLGKKEDAASVFKGTFACRNDGVSLLLQ